MNEEKICCPKFNPEKWDQKTFSWDQKLFIKETVPALFHVPFFPLIGKKITKMCQLVEKEKVAEADIENTLMLFHDPTAFKSEIYVSVTGPVEGANNASLSGTFMAKVFDGGYNDIPKFVKIMDGYLAETGKKAKDYYVHYAYCPKCAKKYGNNYMILFAKV